MERNTASRYHNKSHLIDSQSRRVSTGVLVDPKTTDPGGTAQGSTQADHIGAAYDVVAPDYDEMMAKDLWMRKVLWRHFTRRFHPGDHVMDVGCGTGLDALFLARHGIRVTGLDASAQMIAQLQAKIDQHALSGLVTANVHDYNQLGAYPSACVDGIISAFAGINTVTNANVFATEAHRLLRPRGHLVLHMLGPGGVWKQRETTSARRRPVKVSYREDNAQTIVVCGQPLRHLSYTALESYRRLFSSDFQLIQAYGLGFILSYAAAARMPRFIVDGVGRIEYRLGAFRPFLNWGRFFVLDLQKKDSC